MSVTVHHPSHPAPSLPPALDLDLLAHTIQQGRDHGLPGYSRYRSLCGLTAAETFDELNKTMTEEKRDMLRGLYSSLDEVL